MMEDKLLKEGISPKLIAEYRQKVIDFALDLLFPFIEKMLKILKIVTL